MIPDADLDIFVAWLKRYLTQESEKNRFAKARLPTRLMMIDELVRRAQLTSKGVQMEMTFDGD